MQQKQTTKRAGIGQGTERKAAMHPAHAVPYGARRTRGPKRVRASRDWSHVKDLGNVPENQAHLAAANAFLFGDHPSSTDQPVHATMEILRTPRYQWQIGGMRPDGTVIVHPDIASACAVRGFRAADVVATVIAKNEKAVGRGEAPGITITGPADAPLRCVNADPVLTIESLIEVVDYQFNEYIAGGRA